MINNPHRMDEVRKLTSKIPTLNSIAPMVRIRSFFIATALHQQLRSCMGIRYYRYMSISCISTGSLLARNAETAGIQISGLTYLPQGPGGRCYRCSEQRF
jgi:hypothetical protein